MLRVNGTEVLSQRRLATLLALLAIGVQFVSQAEPAEAVAITFREHLIAQGDGPRLVHPVDLNGDGELDVLTVETPPGLSSSDVVAWHESDGRRPPGWTTRLLRTSEHGGVRALHAADLDADGDADPMFVTRTRGQSFFSWVQNDGSSGPFSSRGMFLDGPAVTSAVPADADGDGDIDVIVGSESGTSISWLENDGGVPPRFTSRAIRGSSAQAAAVFAADFDGNGRTDILASLSSDNSLVALLNQGGSPPSWLSRTISTSAAASQVYADDIDGDGDTDAVAASFTRDELSWFANLGGGRQWARRMISSSLDGPSSVFTRDMDGDGDIDVLSASALDHKVAWHESDGRTPPAWTFRPVKTNARGAASVHATDIDDDGDTDVLSASFDDGKIAWHENRTPSLTVGNAVTTEGDGAVFTVKASARSNKAMSVLMSIGDGTSTAGGSDYQRVDPIELTLDPGDTSVNVSIRTLQDTLDEFNETLVVTLSKPVNATISDGIGRGTIVDDDDAPTLAIGDVRLAEGTSEEEGGTTIFAFEASLSAASGKEVTAEYGTTADSAEEKSDFQPSFGKVVIAPGATTNSSQIQVQVVADKDEEREETFFVGLRKATGVSKIVDGNGIGTIVDDDTPI